jgi:hypothetical protein
MTGQIAGDGHGIGRPLTIAKLREALIAREPGCSAPKDPGQATGWVPTEAWSFITQF